MGITRLMSTYGHLEIGITRLMSTYGLLEMGITRLMCTSEHLVNRHHSVDEHFICLKNANEAGSSFAFNLGSELERDACNASLPQKR